MEIAALPSCEKSLFAGAKVAFFSQKIHPDSRVTDCRGVIISINKEYTCVCSNKQEYLVSRNREARSLQPLLRLFER